MIGVPRMRFATVRLIAVAALALAAIPPATSGLAAHEAPKMGAGSPVTKTQLARTQLAQSTRETDPECYCWANGQRFAHGEQACIRGGGATRLATCDRVINVMSWSFSAEPCPES
jgi:hypothetical protein